MALSLGLPFVPVPRFIAPALSLSSSLPQPTPNKFGFFNSGSMAGANPLATPFQMGGAGGSDLASMLGLGGGAGGGSATPTMPSVNISNSYSNPFSSNISIQDLPPEYKNDPGRDSMNVAPGAPYGKAGGGGGDGSLQGLDINYINRMLGGVVPAGYRAIGTATSIAGSGFNNPYATQVGNSLTNAGTRMG